MKIFPIIQKIESPVINQKKIANISKGDFISIVYYDFEKEQIRLQKFTGVCTKLKYKGMNTKISVRSSFSSLIAVEQEFFVYSPSILEITRIKKTK